VKRSSPIDFIIDDQLYCELEFDLKFLNILIPEVHENNLGRNYY
jgi:hypothetical protein